MRFLERAYSDVPRRHHAKRVKYGEIGNEHFFSKLIMLIAVLFFINVTETICQTFLQEKNLLKYFTFFFKYCF